MPHSYHSDLAYTVGRLDHRVEALEEVQGKMKRDMETLRTWGQRVGILLTLWTAGASAHLSSSQLSDLLAQVIKVLLTK